MSRTIFLIAVIIGVIVILYPKYSGYGYGGKVYGTGSTIYRKEMSCVGFKYKTTNGDRWGVMQCIDCGPTYYCVGVPHTPRCYQWMVTDINDSSTERPSTCP